MYQESQSCVWLLFTAKDEYYAVLNQCDGKYPQMNVKDYIKIAGGRWSRFPDLISQAISENLTAWGID